MSRVTWEQMAIIVYKNIWGKSKNVHSTPWTTILPEDQEKDVIHTSYVLCNVIFIFLYIVFVGSVLTHE